MVRTHGNVGAGALASVQLRVRSALHHIIVGMCFVDDSKFRLVALRAELDLRWNQRKVADHDFYASFLPRMGVGVSARTASVWRCRTRLRATTNAQDETFEASTTAYGHRAQPRAPLP